MIFFFLLVLRVAVVHLIKGGGPGGTPSPEAYCPLGGLANLYQWLTTGGFIRHIHLSNMVLFAAVVLLTLVAARGFCGWICPFGSVQEWIGLIGKKIFRKRFNPTGAWDRYLRYLKYVLLVVIIALTWHTGSLVFRDYDPFLAFFRFGEEMDKTPWAYWALALVLIGSLFIERFFCKYACPLGALLGVMAKFGLTKIERDPQECKDCDICFKKCNARVDLVSSTSIKSAECNQCMDCLVDCPRPSTLSMGISRWRFSHVSFAVVLLAGMGALVGLSMATGHWQTKASQIVLTDASGQPGPDGIRGWMTLEDISEQLSISLEELYGDNGIPSSVPATTRLNRIHSDYEAEVEPDDIREYVRRRLAGEGIVAPAQAGFVSPPARQHDPKDPERKQGGGQPVRGSMTLNEIALTSGVLGDCLAEVLELPACLNPRVPVREWLHEHNLSMDDLREAVQLCQKKDR